MSLPLLPSSEREVAVAVNNAIDAFTYETVKDARSRLSAHSQAEQQMATKMRAKQEAKREADLQRVANELDKALQETHLRTAMSLQRLLQPEVPARLQATCCVCQAQGPETTFVVLRPCYHVCLCTSCSKEFSPAPPHAAPASGDRETSDVRQKCPHCRLRIIEIRQVYM